jgi:hypothetical protein
MIFYVVFVEFNAICNLFNADAFVSGVHRSKLFVTHFDGAEA